MRNNNNLKPVKRNNSFKTIGAFFMLLIATVFFVNPVSAHCDSYDGPVIKDAFKALESNNVNLVLKWVNEDQEEEIIGLFGKLNKLKNGDNEVYSIVEKHFLETLVRLHRETEGAPYTGLKPAGTTKMIIQLSDTAILTNSADDLVSKLNNHIETVVREKYEKAAELYKVKDESIVKGRQYVKAYVDYTHTLEAIHAVLEHGDTHAH